VYQISKNFPADERFGATQQIRRAALSITCNLAEGSSRHKSQDKARFSEIAYLFIWGFGYLLAANK
jgi:four helix bundle protein